MADDPTVSIIDDIHAEIERRHHTGYSLDLTSLEAEVMWLIDHHENTDRSALIGVLAGLVGRILHKPIESAVPVVHLCEHCKFWIAAITDGTCRRFPRIEKTPATHWCGEWQLKV